jgi:4-hydroxybenzoate polyprenyltransferase
MRLHKPIGILLLLWPTLWALWIAGNGSPDWRIVWLFVAGVIVMRSAGCVINDVADRNFDAHVARTKSRPLASKQVNVTEALVLFAGLLIIALLIVLQLNRFTIYLSFIAVLLAAIYPFTKRFTQLPQFILGAAFAWSVPMAFAAQTNSIPAVAWLVFLIALLWPVIYDTFYAMADRPDDLKIGIKSTAILFGKFDRVITMLLQILVILLLIVLGLWLSFTLFYYIGLLLAGLLFVYQQYLIKDRKPQQCFKAFLNNQWFGLVVFLAILVSYKF